MAGNWEVDLEILILKIKLWETDELMGARNFKMAETVS
jgi:hypothetical protein